ncbi:HAAS signaling domain-containing protein [Actinoplanes sp. CA-051413]|uniref:HAAS signaling domain-containing protein n=1 Tax=Actinoplanes sp. CA-051413 TaxID=3239899 RepID=UPI003D9874C3
MSDKTNDAVAEYLHELELRLTGLPVLQRRELLAEIAAHISNERVERGVTSEGELLELLERLGSPEVVAAAAYEEAGMAEPVLSYAGATSAARRPLPAVAPPPDSPPPAYAGPFTPDPGFARASYAPPPVAGPPFAPPPPTRKPGDSSGLRVVIGVAIAVVVFVLLGCMAGAFLLTRSASVDAPAVSVVPGTEAPLEPDAPDVVPVPPTVE